MISTVEPGSLAEQAGIRPGDQLININGHAIRDVIDYQYHASDTRLNIVLCRPGHDSKSQKQQTSVSPSSPKGVSRGGDHETADYTVHITKDYDDPLGIDFTAELFDGVHTCRNRCVFCFVDNLPRGMRRSLYIKDDDYRLSFLHSNFVTLSNVSEEDIHRIIEQHLSPLYISVHATRPDLRKGLLRPRDCLDIMPLLKRLAEARIQFHTQIVVCPDLNDGEILDNTIEDLSGLYPSVLSIGVVPVGLTRYSKTELRLCDEMVATNVIRQVEGRQRDFQAEYDTRLVYASDEFYLKAHKAVPGERTYEGYPQYENGIGIVRSFLNDLSHLKRAIPPLVKGEVRRGSVAHQTVKPKTIGLITGRSAEPFIRQLAEVLNGVGGLQVEVLPIDNDFFGHTVTVAGLITGQDIMNQLQGKSLPDVLFVPRVMLRDNALLDDVTLEELEYKLLRPVIPVEPSPAAALNLLVP